MQPINFVAPVSFVLSVVLMPPYLRWLRSKQIEQFIREEGPQSHAAKAKTPTMGGLCFMAVSVVVACLYIFAGDESAASLLSSAGNAAAWPDTAARLAGQKAAAASVLAVAVLCGLVGFIDDFAKLTSRSNKGLSAAARLLSELALGLLLSALLYCLHAAPHAVAWLGTTIAFTGAGKALYLLVLIPFLVAATSNSINLHDGMDGLSAGTASLVFAVLFLMLAAVGQPFLAAICAAMVGALIGFLVFNKYPARVFMGDSGSLYIGAMMAAAVAASGLLVWFIPLALIYIAETLSVIAQVLYFKATKPYVPPHPMSKLALLFFKLTKRLPGEGKRLLRMAPLHHHIEAIAADRGQPEWKVVADFWLAQFVLCAATYAVFRYLPP